VTINTICDWWEEHKYPVFIDNFDIEAEFLRFATIENEKYGYIQQKEMKEKNWRFSNLSKFWVLFYSSFSRQRKVNYRNFITIMFTSYMLIFFGIIVSNLIGQIALGSTISQIVVIDT